MFSLIITIISIALVAVLVLAAIYYGGPALNKSADAATVTEALNKSNQIAGAFELYKADHLGALPTGTQQQIIDTLITEKYLRSWPSGTGSSSWSLTNDYASVSGLTESQCTSINTSLGITGAIPLCSDPAYAGKSYCCTDGTP